MKLRLFIILAVLLTCLGRAVVYKACSSLRGRNPSRKCHFEDASEETSEFPPKGVTYPKEMGRPPSGKLTNDNAYHTKCISCHEAAMKRDATLKAPQACADCHVKK